MSHTAQSTPTRRTRPSSRQATLWLGSALVVGVLVVWRLWPADAGALGLAALASMATLALRPATVGVQRVMQRKVGTVRLSPSAWVEIERELERARRYERPLALILIILPRGDAEEPPERSGVDPATLLRASVRRTDTLVVDGPDVYMLIPEAGRSACTALITRVGDMHPHLDLMANTSVAVFPEDGLTVEGLVQGLARGGSSSVRCGEPA